MERCKYELFIEKYFGLNTDDINEKTPITADFGQLVNVLAMFDNEPCEGKETPKKPQYATKMTTHPDNCKCKPCLLLQNIFGNVC